MDSNGSQPEELQLPPLDVVVKAIKAARTDEDALRLLNDFSLAVKEDTLHEDAMGRNPLAEAPGVVAALGWVKIARDLYDLATAPNVERDAAIYMIVEQLKLSASALAGQSTKAAAKTMLREFTAMLSPDVSEQEGLERIADGLLVALAEDGEHRAKIIRALVAARKMTGTSEERRTDPSTGMYL